MGGAVQYPKDYLKQAYDLVRERGGVCIADEVRRFERTVIEGPLTSRVIPIVHTNIIYSFHGMYLI